ncbi:uncharacterized protein LOC124439830 [Xenia sp. Carnegie-2017]|uniref:uncharacterized protein LOC124439830 n=1 Tax=Xenia sp. Carnegie-2017 TaxID=2897299 RepID=UPI001F04C53B|nr:uncharacterized protein LOC124439830 [Xenia sp. Carnegie-2017]XP_046846046.1 uncharacterized protein LOC124439830 [Xenia sp. Carnegie-2017]
MTSIMSLDYSRGSSQTLEELLFTKPSTKHGNPYELRLQMRPTAAKVCITVLSFLAVFLEHFFTFKLLRQSQFYLFTHWICSIVIIIAIHLVNKRKSSFYFDKKYVGAIFHHFQLLFFYVLTLYISETDLATQTNSQGSPAFLVNLCLLPLIVTAALTCVTRNQTTSWVSALTVIYSGLMLMTVCTDDGSCYISFKDAAFNVAFTALYGMYMINIEQSLYELSVIHVLFLINIASVFSVPILMTISKEAEVENPFVLLEILKPTVIIPLVCLKAFKMVTMLLQIKLTSVTTCVMTRSLAWIPTCIAISVVCKIELMVSSFKAYWIVFSSCLLYVFPNDFDSKRPK